MAGNWLAFLERLPGRAILAGSLLLVALVAYADYVTGEELSLLLFYLVPIGIAAWCGNRAMGVLVAVFAGVAWVGNEIVVQSHNHPGVFAWNALMRISVFAVLASLLSTLRARLVDITIQARTDALTGLYNRRFMHERTQDELSRSRRFGRPFTLVSIDVDNFKAVNDRYGHATGDAVLCAVGRAMQEDARSIDVAARMGGDEFAVLLVETGEAAAADVAEKLQNRLREHLGRVQAGATCSVGVVSFEQPPASVDDIFRHADEQLYRAKHYGKDCLARAVFSAAGMSEIEGQGQMLNPPRLC